VLKYGPLVYSGTATITEADERTYEVSCPVDNGELAQLFKSIKLSDIDLGGIRTDVNETIRCKASLESDMEILLSDPEPFTHIVYPPFTIIDQNPNGELNSSGINYTSTINAGLSILITINCLSISTNTAFLRIYKNGVSISETAVSNVQSVIVDTDVEAGDIITWDVFLESIGDTEHSIEFIIYEDTLISIMLLEIEAAKNGTALYPNGDYVAFPFENRLFLDKLEDAVYAVDSLSAKELYSKYYPVLNYYSLNIFPVIMTGNVEGEQFTAYNLFNPFPYLAYVIKRICETFGITIDNNVFEDIDLKQLVIFNLYAENNFFTSELITPKEGFNLTDHVPDVLISTYWTNLCKLLGIGFDYKAFSKTLRLKYLKDIAASADFADFPGIIISKPTLKAEPYNGYKLKQEASGDEFITKFFKGIDGLTFKGNVEAISDFDSITGQEINDCYYVTSRKEYWYWNYDPELSIITWLFYSKDFFFVKESVDEEIGDRSFDVITNINPIMDNGYPYTDQNLCAPSSRLWLIPKSEQAGNFDGLPDFFKSEFSKSLLFYHGLRQDSQLNLYPLASNNIYDFAGNPIVFESVEGGDPGYTHDLSLRWDGPNGLYEKRYKHWINLMLKSRGMWRLTAHLSPLQLSKIDWFTWYNGPGYKFLIKEIRFNINHDKISVADIDILIR
jgi:hypothetical protein